MVRTSLSIVISTILCVTVLVVTATTLTLSYTGALKSVRAIGTAYTESVARTALVQTENYFTVVSDPLKVCGKWTKQQGFAFPNETANPFDMNKYYLQEWAKPYLFLGQQNMLITGDSVYSSSFLFLDGSSVNVARENRSSIVVMVSNCLRRPSPGYCEANSGRLNETSRVITFAPDLQTRFADFTVMDTYTGVALVSSQWRLTGVFAFPTVAVRNPNDNSYFLISPLSILLRNSSGTVLAAVTNAIKLQRLNEFLPALHTTANAYTFLADASDTLLASSHPHNFTYNWTYTGTRPRSVPGTCADSGANENSTVGMVICRSRLSTFPYEPLNRVAEDTAFRNRARDNLIAEEMAFADGRYYVAAGRVPSDVLYLQLTLFIFTPESDVIGAIVKSRDTSIGIAVAIFVVAALIASALVARLLRPLDEISRRMYLAASFEDGNEEAMESLISEIHALQDSYQAMNKQLNRIKSFVPQSVLMAADDDDIEVLGEHGATETGGAGASPDIQSRFGVSFVGDKTGISESRVDDSQQTAQESAEGLSARGNKEQPSADTHSLRSVKSVQSARGNVGGVAVLAMKTLNTGQGLTVQPISVIAFNLVGFHQATKELGIDQLIGAHKKLVALICSETVESRGVVDSFHGDRFYCSFNAVKPCANHGQRAMAVALKVQAALREIVTLRMTCGVASGSAHVGNLGSAGMKRFNAIGPVYTQATVLERLCKQYRGIPGGDEVAILTHDRAMHDTSHAAFLQCIDAIPLPMGKKGTVVQRVAVARDPATIIQRLDLARDSDDMKYLLGQIAEANPWRDLNDAFALAIEGREREARKALKSFAAADIKDDLSLFAVATCTAIVEGKKPFSDAAAPVVAEFYSKCVL